MKALIQTDYGSSDVLRLKDVPRPVASDGEVLVRVVAASLAAGDRLMMHGTPFPARLMIGLLRDSDHQGLRRQRDGGMQHEERGVG